MCDRWASTVLGDTNSASAICRLVSPAATCSATASSERVSAATTAAEAPKGWWPWPPAPAETPGNAESAPAAPWPPAPGPSAEPAAAQVAVSTPGDASPDIRAAACSTPSGVSCPSTTQPDGPDPRRDGSAGRLCHEAP